MKCNHKYTSVAIGLSFLLCWSVWKNQPKTNTLFLAEKNTDKKSHPAFDKSVGDNSSTLNPEEDEASAFEFGIYRGVAAIQLEQAMAERKIPPLKPILNDVNAPLSTTMKRILIVSTWRTGSSFLGDLILSAPSVFYSYEPLHFIDEEFTQLPSTLNQSMALVRGIFNCQFQRDYLEHISGGKSAGKLQQFMTRNRRVWEACYHRESLCLRPDYVGRLCSHFSVQLMKVVRMRLWQAQQLLQHFTGDSLKIIYLVRDPRGTMASRAKLKWCSSAPCNDADALCGQMNEDVALVKRLRRKHPHSFYLLRFEDLSADVGTETDKLFRFLRLPVTMTTKVFLTTHTGMNNRNQSDPYATNRKSEDVASRWRKDLPPADIDFISSRCADVLKTLHYEI